ncbi:MAG TPA: hypothetical protein PLI45_04515 [Candidatus Woesebacteria bacterium]|nr:hypothetical protein [Candidatus Woesebacteria bacterium]
MAEKPVLYPFMVYYIKTVSTWNNEWQQHGKRMMMLESRPIGDDRKKLEIKMEEDFIDQHHKRRKNLADVTYKITRIVAISPKS